MKTLCLLIMGLLLVSGGLFAQVGISNDNSAPENAAMLDVKSSGKGVLIPRMTFAQRNAIGNPVEGLMVYCTNCNTDGTGVISVYQSGLWINFYGKCMIPAVPSAGTHVPSLTQIVWNWNVVPIALGYKWNTVNNFGSALDMGASTSMTETGLTCWTAYTRYVWAYNACGQSALLTLTESTLQVPMSQAPAAGTHVSTFNSVVWNWSTMPGAAGYKWNTANDYLTATDMGSSTSKSEIGLACNTVYTRYAWAYTSCGCSAPLTMNQTTSPCCGVPITIDHVAGPVAPVTKTVIYNTVYTIPGEMGKCWITSNLGSDHQATAVNDMTEPSAGWYWQFNRMQGYKHDGTTRTPATAWISPISEVSNWLAENDPCQIELGQTWRIPTHTEWFNVDYGGNWTNWTGPWNSALKMHAAGQLSWLTGNLSYRGSEGFYWSNQQSDYDRAQCLQFESSNSGLVELNKADGVPLRCIRIYFQ